MGTRGATPDALLKGTLDMLVLRALEGGKTHGYGVATRLRERSHEAILVEEGSLYPALHRLDRRGWVRTSWGVSENNRRAKFYELTARGRRQLRDEVAAWRRMSAAIARVLDGSSAGDAAVGEAP